MDKSHPPYHAIAPEDFDGLPDAQHGIRRAAWRRLVSRYGQLLLSLTLALLLFWSVTSQLWAPPPLGRPGQDSQSATAIFRNLYAPFVHSDISVAPTYFSDVTNTTKTLSGKRIWTKPLGKEVLILDLDTRSVNGSNQILHDGEVRWNDLERSSAGMLNHYLYSLIHGYSYKFIHAANLTDRFASWTKPSTLAALLTEDSPYRFVVFADADAIYNHIEIPFESLLNHWNITPSTSLAVSLDPAWCIDSRFQTGLNTGFIIAQNNARTREILNAWTECPEGERWPECAQYKNKKVFEQTAFNEYVRYEFQRKNDIKPLPCDETDGYPGSPDLCNGEILRHFWRAKGRVKGGVEDSMFNLFGKSLDELRKQFFENREELTVEAL